MDIQLFIELAGWSGRSADDDAAFCYVTQRVIIIIAVAQQHQEHTHTHARIIYRVHVVWGIILWRAIIITRVCNRYRAWYRGNNYRRVRWGAHPAADGVTTAAREIIKYCVQSSRATRTPQTRQLINCN